MLASEILSHLQSFPFKIHFGGIFSSDSIPKNLRNKHFLIVNTDVKSGPGKHWYTVLRLNDSIECFDSLGIQEDKKVFICNHFSFRGIRSITYNTTQVQPSSSILCGQYVLFFLFERYHNLDLNFDDLVNEIFSENMVKMIS